MSALPLTPTPAPTRPALRLVRGDGAVAAPLTGGGDGSGGHPMTGLAPTSRAQAWRRRIGALVLALSPLTVFVVALGPVDAAVPTTLEATTATQTVTTVVEPGETLWEVAARTRADGVSTAQQVQALRDANEMSASALRAWQVLRLP